MPGILFLLQEESFLFHMHPELQVAYPDTEETDVHAVHGYPKDRLRLPSSDLQCLSLRLSC